MLLLHFPCSFGQIVSKFITLTNKLWTNASMVCIYSFCWVKIQVSVTVMWSSVSFPRIFELVISPIPNMQSHNTDTMVCLYLSRCSGYILQLADNSSVAEPEERRFRLQDETVHMRWTHQVLWSSYSSWYKFLVGRTHSQYQSGTFPCLVVSQNTL